MSSSPEVSDYVSYKVEKLHGSDDFATWRGDVRMLLRGNDPGLLGLEPEPIANTAAAHAAWKKAEAKEKTSIVLNLGPVVKVPVRN